MIALPAGARVLLATKPVDFRKGAHSLAALAAEVPGADPFSGAVLVFRSRRADRIRILVWEEWLYGPGSGAVDDSDVAVNLHDAVVLRCVDDDDSDIGPSSSSRGACTNRPAFSWPRTLSGARAADRALEAREGFPVDGMATENGCRGPPLHDCPG